MLHWVPSSEMYIFKHYVRTEFIRFVNLLRLFMFLFHLLFVGGAGFKCIAERRDDNGCRN